MRITWGRIPMYLWLIVLTAHDVHYADVGEQLFDVGIGQLDLRKYFVFECKI